MVDISGTVTDQDGNGIEGVKVTVINESTDSVATTTTTDANGDYLVSVGTNTYHVIIQYTDSNGDFYNSPSNPFVS